MPQSTLTYIISFIRQNVPRELLELAFQPRKYNTTIEQRIISEIIEGPILLDTNLVGGKRKEIYIQTRWLMNLKAAEPSNVLGTGVEGSFYLIPEEAREYRNISSVIGVTPFIGTAIPGSGANYNGTGSFGNTATNLISEMLNTRTFSDYPVMPLVTLEGTNIIRFYPEIISDGVAISVLLEFDSEFLNMNNSSIMAMRNLCLCATKRYIANKLIVPVDETEIVAGMEIGVIKDLINRYSQEAEQYQELLMRLKGSLSFDPKMINRLIYHAL